MELPDINKRILQLVDYYAGRSVKKFAESIGIPQQTVNRLFNKDTRTGRFPMPTTEVLVSITKKYVCVNAAWLLTGEGLMLKDESPKTETAQDRVLDFELSKHIEELTEVIMTQAKTLFEQQQLINATVIGGRNSPPLIEDVKYPENKEVK